MTKADAPKVKHPHPIMQLGTPSLDIESDHIMQFMVFRMGGSNPIHVKNIPRDVTDPLYIRKHVGGGRYQIKAQAEGATSGKAHGCVLGATIYEWDGAPILDAPPASPYAAGTATAAPAPSFFEQAASNGPAIVGALGTALGGIMQIINSGREAREREEQRRREDDERRRREEREDRDRKEARERQEAEERREIERRRDEERRDRDRIAAEERHARETRESEERRAERERIEQARLDQQRAETEARIARETAMMEMMMSRRDPNDAIIQTLLQRALNPPTVPVPNPTASVDSVLDAARKLKEFTDGDSDEKMVIAGLQALASPGGSKLIDMAAGFLGRRPEQTEQAPVVTQEPMVMEQLPPAPAEAPPPPPPEQVVVPGPVTIN